MNTKLLNSAGNTQRFARRRMPTFVATSHRGMISYVLAFAMVAVWSTAAIAKPPPGGKLAPRGSMPAAIGPKAPAAPENVVVPDGPRPAIVADEPIHDFGAVWVGPLLKHSFVIKNEGTEVLKITRVKPSCGCTIAGDYPKELKPGESGSFPFSLTSSKLHGKFEKAVTVTSDDPVTPNLRLRLRGEVKRYIEMTPMNIQFGKLFGAESQSRVIKLTNNTETAMKLTLPKQPGHNLKAELVETSPGQAYELRVTANPPFEPGVFKEDINIDTNIEGQASLKIDVRGMAPQRLDISPSVLTLASNAENKLPITRVVRFTNYGSTPVKLLSATSDDPEIGIEVKEQTAGQAYSIQVKFPPNHVVPPTGQTLTLKTDDKERPSITVPVRSGRTPVARTPQRRPAETMVGQRAPEFAGKTIDGKSLSTAELKDNVTVLDFFAVNCGFCKKQMPRLETVRQAYEGKGVRFVAVSQTMRKPFSDDETKAKIKELGFGGELLIDSDNVIGPRFRATSYPTMVVIGKKGRIDAVNIGNVADLESRLKGQLDALLAGKPVPADDPAVAKKNEENKPADILAKADVKPGEKPDVKLEAKPQAPKPPARKRAAEMIGQAAPTFTIETFDGKTINNATFANHPAMVMNFVAGNCGYCKKQIPRIEKIRSQFEAKGVRFVNVFETMGTPFTKEQVVDKMKEMGAHMEVAHDPENAVGPMFGTSGFPTMVIVGKSGKFEAVNVGNMADLETRMATQLNALIEGKPVPTVAQAPPVRKRADDLIGKPAPKFTINTLDGKTLGSDDFAKHPATILNFVASNCGYCKKQVPRLDKLRESYEAKGIRIVNVVQTMRQEFSPEEVKDIFDKTGSKIELAHDPKNKVGPLFSASGFPTMVVVGKSGNVEAVNVGNIPDLEPRVSGQLDALIAGKPLPKVAAAPPRSTKRPAEEMVGKPVPTFALSTIDGKSISNTDIAGSKATVLNFVAPNCGFCKKQLPNLEKVRAEYEAKGVRFVNVVQKMRKEFTQEEIVDIFKGVGSQLEITLGDFASNATGQAFKATSFPTMFVVGKDGKVAHVNIGAKPDLVELVKGQLDALLKS